MAVKENQTELEFKINILTYLKDFINNEKNKDIRVINIISFNTFSHQIISFFYLNEIHYSIFINYNVIYIIYICIDN